jgi:pimeloyl-ACP methyl ester carboxylesterase
MHRYMLLMISIGASNSTHYKEKRLDTSFWTIDLFMAELDNLLTHLSIADDFDLLGQSWGGMLGSQYATRQPKGLKRLVISNSPASMPLWVESCNEWRKQLPREVDEALTKYEDAKDYENEGWHAQWGAGLR